MNSEFDRRKKMIAALEGGGDQAVLTELVKNDVRLSAYHSVLLYVASHLKDAALLKSLLDLPVLDKKSDAYRWAVERTFTVMAANKMDCEEGVITALFAVMKDDQELKDRSLSFIFQTVVSHGLGNPDLDLTRMLVENGANVEEASKPHRDRLEGEKRIIEAKEADIAVFTAKLTPS